jgi:light-regulated signal transduction histidine kinase (bacteriophytochrome)
MRYRDKLFAPFQRLHRAEDFEGTGIGLVTIARILARHGGDASIEGVEGHGATVYLFIPAVE